jgi:transketolase
MVSFNQLANAIRFLSVDAVEHAQSGHPGMPLGMADIATVLWTKFLKHNPINPNWFNRDRFVLSNGHGSMLLYALLHLTGYDLSLEDLKQFRQLNSKTPGHPEYSHTPGVETTTGPLGQGLANAVGMALAEHLLATQYNTQDLTLINHYTYAFVGDGCLMEGISHEVCSLAGTLKLNKLIVFYDANGISIDGPIENWFTDDTTKRFQAYHWNVIGPIDGHNPQAIENAILQAQQNTQSPTLIICNTIIGYGSCLAGSEKTHGSPLGQENIAKLRVALDWPELPFVIPKDIQQAWCNQQRGQEEDDQWQKICTQYQQQFPKQYETFIRRIQGILPKEWHQLTHEFIQQCPQKPMATRQASQYCLNYLTSILPEMLGGSADLTPSNNTNWNDVQVISPQNISGRYLHYGVREFGMCAIMNGIALHQGFIPFGGTFLVFADYAKNAIRLAAMMHQKIIFVLTHDSIALGEDGPTHQPIEQASMLRMIPNMTVWRPADLTEVAVAWQQAIEHQGPSCLLLSRQTLPHLPHKQIDLIKRGGYIVHNGATIPDVILIATGSEVQIALACVQPMLLQGITLRVVSMPSTERFLAQDLTYQNSILPPQIRARIAIEAASCDYWYKFVGLDGAIIGLKSFGVSAPGQEALDYFEITQEKVITAIYALQKKTHLLNVGDQ